MKGAAFEGSRDLASRDSLGFAKCMLAQDQPYIGCPSCTPLRRSQEFPGMVALADCSRNMYATSDATFFGTGPFLGQAVTPFYLRGGSGGQGVRQEWG